MARLQQCPPATTPRLQRPALRRRHWPPTTSLSAAMPCPRACATPPPPGGWCCAGRDHGRKIRRVPAEGRDFPGGLHRRSGRRRRAPRPTAGRWSSPSTAVRAPPRSGCTWGCSVRGWSIPATRLADAGAVRAGRQPGNPAAARRPGDDRSGQHRLLPGGGRQRGRRIPRVRGGPGPGGRSHPALDHAQQPLAQPEYLVGESYGTLRAVAVAGGCRRLRDGRQRAGTDFHRAEPGHAGFRPGPRHPLCPAPAHLRSDRAFPRAARGPGARRGGARGRGLCRKEFWLRPDAGQRGCSAESSTTSSAGWPKSPPSSEALSAAPTCAGTTRSSPPSCCGTRAWWWAGSMAVSPRPARQQDSINWDDPSLRGHQRALLGGHQPLCARRAGLRERPAV